MVDPFLLPVLLAPTALSKDVDLVGPSSDFFVFFDETDNTSIANDTNVVIDALIDHNLSDCEPF